jgi:hypothetical protein
MGCFANGGICGIQCVFRAVHSQRRVAREGVKASTSHGSDGRLETAPNELGRRVWLTEREGALGGDDRGIGMHIVRIAREDGPRARARLDMPPKSLVHASALELEGRALGWRRAFDQGGENRGGLVQSSGRHLGLRQQALTVSVRGAFARDGA